MSHLPLPGLEHRLGLRSRRSGLMIGVSIMTAIGILVGGFTLIFTVLDPLVSDFVGPLSQPTQVVAGEALAARGAPGNASGPDPAPRAAAQATAAPTEPPDAPTPTPTAEAPPPEDAFTPDYRVSSQQRINFRAGPGVDSAAIAGVEPGTELQSLDESQATQNPAADRLSPDGEWLRFRLEDGREGWIRDVDVNPVNP